MKRTVITGTGSYIPSVVIKNSDFSEKQFYGENGVPITTHSGIIIEKFLQITGIAERRYVTREQNTSDIAALSALPAIEQSGIDREQLDMIIVAHNFGDVSGADLRVDTVPALASRVKARLGIINPQCIAFDVLFGCPGWILAMMQADAFFKAGMANKALIIGAEILSRVVDHEDRDSMLFSDGAGSAVLEFKESKAGLLSSGALSHCRDEVDYLKMGPAYNTQFNQDLKFMKMKGRKVYEYALKHVPAAMKTCLENSGQPIERLKKIFLHQANEKMDEAIVQAFYGLYGLPAPEFIMPMCIRYLGNSSVATIPTLFDLVSRGCDRDHSLAHGDLVMFASVGAGMNINAVCYEVE